MVVPYIGTWIETKKEKEDELEKSVVPYIGTWIETCLHPHIEISAKSYLI